MAVSAVVIFHAFPNVVTGGFVGVDVFFVISGFLITSIIQRGLQEGRFSFLQFYARRIRRIFPALAVVLVSCLVAGWFLLLPDEFAQLGNHAAAGAAFMSNLVLWRQSGYFEEESSRTILLHLWSLGIEEQFYLVWPLFLVAAWKLRLPAMWTILAVLVGSFALNMWTIRFDPTGTFYSPFTRSWELAIGALLATTGGASRGPHIVRQLLSVGGVALILASAFLLTEADPFPGWRAAVPTVGAAALIAAGPGAFANRLLSLRLPVLVGKISYPLYLWHWPLLVFPVIVLGGDVPVSLKFAAIILAVVLAAATYMLLERPLRSDRLLIVKAASLALSVSLVAAFGLVANGTHGLPSRPSIAQYVDVQAWIAERTAWPYAENSNCLDRFPSTDRREGWWFCVLEKDAPPTVFLVGNSFANHLYPGLAENPAFRRQNFLQYGTCYPLIGVSFSAYSRGHPCSGEKAEAQAAFVDKIVKENPTIRIALINAPWPAFDDAGRAVSYDDMSKEDGVFRSIPPVRGETSLEAFVAGLDRRIAFLIENNVTPVLFLATPQLDYSPEDCFAVRPLRKATASCQTTMEHELALHRNFRIEVEQILARRPQLQIYDPARVFCDSSVCRMADENSTWLRDVRHLSLSGSVKVAQDFAKWCRQYLPELLD